MKSTRNILVATCCAFLLFSCNNGDDDSGPVCPFAGDIQHTISEPTEGSLYFDEEVDEHYIRYFIEGTIDSFWVGYICSNAFPDFLFTQGMAVRFAGDFREITNGFEPNIQTGGDEYFILDISHLEAI